ncbi:MAG: TetR/AcrR family transcriptional regulator, partial [Anaerolineaceae bacterium]|nr:TetR/AcrR family transcriptional regulator [Anaerolineaceae bacterium]
MEDSANSDHPLKKKDRRIVRTQFALRDALHNLILEKGYDTITVEEITQRAGVGRATFYLHFKDKEDLLLEQFSDLARDRVKLLAEIPLTGWDAEYNPPYLPLLFIFQNAAENAPLYRLVLHGEGAARVTSRLRTII